LGLSFSLVGDAAAFPGEAMARVTLRVCSGEREATAITVASPGALVVAAAALPSASIAVARASDVVFDGLCVGVLVTAEAGSGAEVSTTSEAAAAATSEAAGSKGCDACSFGDAHRNDRDDIVLGATALVSFFLYFLFAFAVSELTLEALVIPEALE